MKAKGNRGRQARLVVVGDGPLREHYYKQANGDKDIIFVGAVLEGRPSYYAHSSVYACPTTKASFGITLLESMACETPVVCSDILGFRDVVVDGREALMVPCGDRDALADALVRVLDDRRPGDPARHHRAAEFARILVGACHVSRARRVSQRSRKRRRRRMILGLGAGAALARRRGARRLSSQQPIFGPPYKITVAVSRASRPPCRSWVLSCIDTAFPIAKIVRRLGRNMHSSRDDLSEERGGEKEGAFDAIPGKGASIP